MTMRKMRQRTTPATSCRAIDPDIANVMLAVVDKQTDQALTDQFGLSYNTWCKVRSGRPIRASLADRVEHRMRAMIGQQSGR